MEEKAKDYFERMKSELMTEEQRELGERMLKYYRDSWHDKDNRGLFDTWQECERYWEGDVNEPEYEDDPASNTNIVHPHIEGQVVLMVDKHTTIEPYAIRPSARPFLNASRVMLNWIKENNKHRQKMDVTARRLVKFGTAVIWVLFNPDYMDGFGLPEYESSHPAYTFFDKDVVDIYHVQDGKYAGMILTKPIAWAKRKFGDVADAIAPGYNPTEDAQLFGEGDGNATDSGMYIHIIMFEKTGDELRFVEMSGDGVILYDSKEWKKYTHVRPTKPYFPNDMRTGKPLFPVFAAPDYFREGTPWGKSDAELSLELQDQLNDYDDQIRSNARLTGNPQKFIDISSGVDPEMWTNQRGLVLPVNGGKESVGYIQPPQMVAEIPNRRDRIMDRDISKVTRFSDQMMGNRIKGVDTATEALSLQQSGMGAIDYKKTILEDLFGQVFEYCLALAVHYWKEEQYFYLLETDEYVYFRASLLESVPKLIRANQPFIKEFKRKNPNEPVPEFMEATDKNGKTIMEKAMIGVKVRMGAGIPQNEAFKYGAVKEARAMGDLTPEEHREYLKEKVGLDLPEPQGNPMIQQQPGMPMGGMPQGTPTQDINPSVQGLTANGNPKKPQSIAKGGIDSVARAFRR
jgi:hypothetical protein